MTAAALPIPPVVDLDRFLARLAELEQWLWDEGARFLGAGNVPKVKALAEQVVELSDLYTLRRAAGPRPAADSRHLRAKIWYFLASDAPKVALVLRELHERYGVKAPPRSLRVLDVGCGIGATAAGLLLALDPAHTPRVLLHGIEQDEKLHRPWSAVARKAAQIAGVDVQLVPVIADLGQPQGLDAKISRDVDLTLIQGVLSELRFETAAAAEWIGRFARRNVTAVIEPALRETTRPLHAARDLLLQQGGLTVLAPCPHQNCCPMLVNERDWCHEIRLIKPTPKVKAVQDITRRRDERTKFSFVTLAASASLSASTIPEGDSGLSGRLVSDPIATKGKTERWLCTSAGSLVQLRLLDRDRTPGNEIVADAPRGEIITLTQGTPLPRIQPEALVRSLSQPQG